MGLLSFCNSRLISAGAAFGLLVSGSHGGTSPLSSIKEGFGLEVSSYNSREKAMGEAGMASVNRIGPSLPNPSKTAFNEKTSFSATFDTDVDYLQDDLTSNRTTSFIIPDIALNFQTRWPLNVGAYYRQRFHRNYTIEPLVKADPDVAESFTTEGGIFELATTVAYAPKPFLALALGYHFLLGRERTIESAAFNQNPNNDDTYNSKNLNGDTVSTRSRGNYPSASVTFRQKSFSLAASATLATSLDRTFTRSISNISSSEQSGDTRDLPWTLQVGGAFKPRQNQTIVADFAYEAWDNAYSELLNPAMRMGAGYEFQGNGTAYEAYYRKVAYRGGVGIERLYLDETNHYFATLGAGLPLGRRGNLFDIALKYGHRGQLENSLWSEDYLQLSVTLTGVSVWGQPVRKRR